MFDRFRLTVSYIVDEILSNRRYNSVPMVVCLSEEYSKFSRKKRSKVRIEAFLVVISCSDGGHFENADGILQISFHKISDASLSFCFCDNSVHSLE